MLSIRTSFLDGAFSNKPADRPLIPSPGGEGDILCVHRNLGVPILDLVPQCLFTTLYHDDLNDLALCFRTRTCLGISPLVCLFSHWILTC